MTRGPISQTPEWWLPWPRRSAAVAQRTQGWWSLSSNPGNRTPIRGGWAISDMTSGIYGIRQSFFWAVGRTQLSQPWNPSVDCGIFLHWNCEGTHQLPADHQCHEKRKPPIAKKMDPFQSPLTNRCKVADTSHFWDAGGDQPSFWPFWKRCFASDAKTVNPEAGFKWREKATKIPSGYSTSPWKMAWISR